jgi:hypothetical protein
MTVWASKGTALQLSISSVYTTIAHLDSIDGPNAEVQSFDATALDSGVGMPFKPTGFVNGGAINSGGFCDPTGTTFQALTDLVTTPAVAQWRLVLPDTAGTQWPFNAFIQNAPKPVAAVGDGLKFDFSAKLDGMVAYPT